jgi:hypothetical protein
MKQRSLLVMTIVAGMLAVMLVVAGLVSAQTDTPGDEDRPPDGIAEQAAPPQEVELPMPVIQIDGPDDDVYAMPQGELAIVNDVIQVQGRLTNPNGLPLSENVTIAATIYDASSGGTALCTDSDTVAVVDGLFTLDMDFCTASDFNGEGVWLGIKVGADAEMTPRQPIFAVPLAWGLRPGAIVRGADSYTFVSGSSLIKNLSADTTTWDILSNGAARIRRGAAAGEKTVYVPIPLPSILYGQAVTIEHVQLYYRVSNSANAYITRGVMNVQTTASGWVNVFDDGTNLTSTTDAIHAYTIAGNNVISNTQGSVVMFFQISFANATDYVDLSGIRLRLGHQ